jgi:hypothetical protein
MTMTTQRCRSDLEALPALTLPALSKAGRKLANLGALVLVVEKPSDEKNHRINFFSGGIAR